MTTLRVLAKRIAALWRRDDTDADLRDELESLAAIERDERLASGASPDEARRDVLARTGSVTSVQEVVRRRRTFGWLDDLARDMRYGLRQWRREPIFTAVAVLSLALGIGANTAIFSLIDHVMLRALPVHEPARLLALGSGTRASGAWSYPVWEQVRAYETLVGTMAASSGSTPRSVTSDGRTMRSQVQMVSGSFHDVLGVHAAMGRALTPHDDTSAQAAYEPVAVISDRYWRARFNAAPGIVGQSILIDRTPFTIVGVMPAGFDGVSVGSTFDVAVPLAAEDVLGGDASRLKARGSWWLQVLVRQPPEDTVDAVTTALRGVQSQIREATLPEGSTPEQHLAEPFTLTPLPAMVSGLRGTYGTPLLLLMSAVGIVLIIACANLAGLWLARASARRHEMGLRLSLGASRARLVAQMLVESLTLALAGAALGLVVAQWAVRLLVSQLQTINMAVVLDVPVDWRMLAFTMTVTLLTAVLVGLGPALHATRSDPGVALKAQSRTLAQQPHTWPALGLLFVQIALSFVLVMSAGLFLRTLSGLIGNVRGVDINRVLITRVFVTAHAVEAADQPVLFERVLEAARRVPGVSVAALSSVTPSQMAMTMGPIVHAGGAPVDLPPRERSTFINFVSPRFFETYGTARLAGRDFSDADTSSATPVAIVNRAFVARFLPGREDVVGLTVVQGGPPGSPGLERTIVGLVENATYVGPQENATAVLYVPLEQASGHAGRGFLHLSVRAAGGDPGRLAKPLADAITSISADISVQTHSLDTQVRSALTRQRLMATLTSALAGLALLLAGIGLYGVMAYAVTQRRREIGVRTALGATPAAVVRLVTTRVAVALVLGLGAGALLARWAGRFVESLLFGVTPGDTSTFALAGALLLTTGLAAALLPAWRAARTSPATALREP